MAVTFKPEALVIELPTGCKATYSDLYELQTNLIELLLLRDFKSHTDGMDVWTGLNLLRATLIEPEGLRFPKNLIPEMQEPETC